MWRMLIRIKPDYTARFCKKQCHELIFECVKYHNHNCLKDITDEKSNEKRMEEGQI